MDCWYAKVLTTTLLLLVRQYICKWEDSYVIWGKRGGYQVQSTITTGSRGLYTYLAQVQPPTPLTSIEPFSYSLGTIHLLATSRAPIQSGLRDAVASRQYKYRTQYHLSGKVWDYPRSQLSGSSWLRSQVKPASFQPAPSNLLTLLDVAWLPIQQTRFSKRGTKSI